MIITEVAGVNWVLPNFKDEYGEVAEAHGKMGERYHAHFPNQETWSSKARLGSKQQVQSNWNVKNTGAFDGTPIDEIPEEQRSRVARMFKNSEPIELPVILKDDNGYILIGGNTRLSMAVATGARPMAWVIDETRLDEILQ